MVRVQRYEQVIKALHNDVTTKAPLLMYCSKYRIKLNENQKQTKSEKKQEWSISTLDHVPVRNNSKAYYDALAPNHG